MRILRIYNQNHIKTGLNFNLKIISGPNALHKDLEQL